jgi:hypothetical protein
MEVSLRQDHRQSKGITVQKNGPSQRRASLHPELHLLYFLFIPRCPPGRPLCSFVLQLNGMRIDNCPNQPGKTLLKLRAPRNVMHFNAPPFSADQPCLSQRSEVLRERGLRNRLVADSQKRRTVLRALLRHDVCVDSHPYWVGQGVKNPLNRNVFDGWMKEGPHKDKSSHRKKVVQ